MKSEPLLETLSDILPLAKAERNLATLGDVRAEAVIDTMAKTLPRYGFARGRTIC